jgi:hypothetical protein
MGLLALKEAQHFAANGNERTRNIHDGDNAPHSNSFAMALDTSET